MIKMVDKKFGMELGSEVVLGFSTRGSVEQRVTLLGDTTSEALVLGLNDGSCWTTTYDSDASYIINESGRRLAKIECSDIHESFSDFELEEDF